MLRQQADYGDSRPNRSLADYVAPAGDHVGAFAVAIHGADELAARFEAEHDDYRAIMVKALADRLAEAFAEYLHRGAPRGGTSRSRSRSSEELIAERYRGIRPAFGYPACPDHSEKAKLFDAARRARHAASCSRRRSRCSRGRVSAASTSHHPEARYFVGRPDRPRPGRGVRVPARARSLAEAERWAEAEPRLRARRAGRHPAKRIYRPRASNDPHQTVAGV